MTAIVPMRAALGFAATLFASSLAIEARAQDASPWQRDGHSAVRLLAGSRSGAVLLGGIAFQLQPGWKTYWRIARRFRRAAAVRLFQIGQYRGCDGVVAGADEIRRWRRRPFVGLSGPVRAAVANCGQKCRQAGDASRRYQLRGMRKTLHSRPGQCRTCLHQRGEHRRQRAVRGAGYRAEAGQCRRSQSADHPRRQA